MGTRHIWASSLLGGVVAVVVGEVILGSTDKPTSSTHTLELVLLAVGVVLVVIALGLFIGIRRARPRLIIDQPDVRELPMYEAKHGPAAGASVTTGTTSLIDSTSVVINTVKEAFLWIRNEPLGRGDLGPARDVVVHLRYLDEGGQVLFTVDARWSSDEMGISYEKATEPAARNLPGNAVRNRFDVAARFVGEAEMYGVDNTVRYENWKKYPLGSGPITIEIEAKGANIRHVERWVLATNGDTLTLVSEQRPNVIGRAGLAIARAIQNHWAPRQPNPVQNQG